MSIDETLESVDQSVGGESPQDMIPTGDPTVDKPEILHKRSRKRNMTVFAIVCLLNVGLLVLLWTQLITPRQTHSPDDPSLVGEVSSPLVGNLAPDFTLPVLNGLGGTSGPGGTQVHLASFKGKPVIVNFWGSWCDPCKQEATFLQQTWTKIQSQGAVMLGIDAPESSDKALQFIHQYGITYTNVEDTIQESTGLDYGITGQPETFFINRNGTVIAHWFGPLTQDGMRTELARLQITLK